jgi:hypothetical protein
VRLADLSDPKVKIAAAPKGPRAVLFANRLARELPNLDHDDVAALIAVLDRARARALDRDRG